MWKLCKRMAINGVLLVSLFIVLTSSLSAKGFQRKVVPQAVAGGGFTTLIRFLSRAATECQMFFFLTKGAGTPNLVGVDLNGQPIAPVVPETIPALGTVSMTLTAGKQSVMAAVADIVTPACFNQVDVQTAYFFEVDKKLVEYFSYGPPVKLSLKGKTRAQVPFNYDPNPTDGPSNTPAVVTVSVNPLDNAERCFQIKDSQGNAMTSQECTPNDGTHDPKSINQIHQTQGKSSGIWEVCFKGQPSSNFSDEIFALFLEVVQKDEIIQFSNNIPSATNPDCKTDETTLCLNDNRFKVEVDWRQSLSEEEQPALVGDINPDDSGLFCFFDPDNLELLVKVLGGCDFNNNFWVFAGALTDVEFTLTVTDTATNTTKQYFNPLGQVAEPITDTSAFATCP